MSVSTTTIVTQDTTNKPRFRLWVLEWGLYPTRIILYLKLKKIESDFEIIPVQVDTSKGLERPRGKPPGTVPILEIERASDDDLLDGKYIKQSRAILEYLEDIYKDGISMRGEDATQRANVRQLLDVLDEGVTHLSQFIHQASELFAPLEEQHDETAGHCRRLWHERASQLEGMADPEGPFLAGDRPSIVDCVLLATVQFCSQVYGVDVLVGHPRLLGTVCALEARIGGLITDFQGKTPPVICEMARKMRMSC